jgi:hypothetical protein
MQFRPLRCVWKQWDAGAEEHRDNGDLDCVYFAHGEKLSEELASAEEPDVFLALRAQGLKRFSVQRFQDRRVGVVGGIECAGGDEGLHALEGWFAEACEGGMVGEAAHERRVELRPEFSEVVVGIDDDPVGLAVWSGDEAVEAHGYSVSDSAHGAYLSLCMDSIAAG